MNLWVKEWERGRERDKKDWDEKAVLFMRITILIWRTFKEEHSLDHDYPICCKHMHSVLWAAATHPNHALFYYDIIMSCIYSLYIQIVVNDCVHGLSGIYDIRMLPQNTACVLSNQTHNTKREASCTLCLSPFDDESICRNMCPTGLCLIMSECWNYTLTHAVTFKTYTNKHKPSVYVPRMFSYYFHYVMKMKFLLHPVLSMF